MATSTLAQRYAINGVVNTDNPVMENLDQLARSSGCFITYDVHAGQWGVVINTTASSVTSFDNSNIIGPINMTTTSLFDLYNQVEVEFPLLDTADKTDYVRINTSNAVRSINEPDNLMKMSLNFCTEPVQAYVLGNIELQQSRLDKVITFQTDYSALQLNAGDVIDVTNDLYQFTNKEFRIITIKEIDGDNGDLRCEITALEYDADIYSTANTPRSVKTDRTGIQTLGAMTAPTISFVKYEASARPEIHVVSSVPNGVVEGVECWISSDGTNYNLRETIKSEDQTLTPGGSVTFKFDDQPAGNVYAKTRGTNYSVAGPFSNVANTTYSPQQITDAIGSDTGILDGAGAAIPLLLGIPSLLGALDTKLNGDAGAMSNIPIITRVSTSANTTVVIDRCTTMATGYSTQGGYDATYNTPRTNQIYFGWSIGANVVSMNLVVQTPTLLMDYEALDQTETVVTLNAIAQPAFEITLFEGSDYATATVVQSSTIDWQTNTNTIILPEPDAGDYWLSARLIPTYQLNMNWVRTSGPQPNDIYFTTFSDPVGTAAFKLTIDITQ